MRSFVFTPVFTLPEYYHSYSLKKLHHARWHTESPWTSVRSLQAFLDQPCTVTYCGLTDHQPIYCIPQKHEQRYHQRFPATGEFVNLGLPIWRQYMAEWMTEAFDEDGCLCPTAASDEIVALMRVALAAGVGLFNRHLFEAHYQLIWIPYSWRDIFSRDVLAFLPRADGSVRVRTLPYTTFALPVSGPDRVSPC